MNKPKRTALLSLMKNSSQGEEHLFRDKEKIEQNPIATSLGSCNFDTEFRGRRGW